MCRSTSPRLNTCAWLAAIAACVFLGPWAEGASAQAVSKDLFQSPNHAQTEAVHDRNCKILYAGIVGGLETPNNKRSGVVQMRDTLGGPIYTYICAKTFSPYHWTTGRNWILNYFPKHPGPMSEVELEQAPKVVIVGHSLGGWAALSVARSLDSKGIPVELTVQVDSVGVTDRTVPKNVKAAAIFHARDILMLLTTKKITVKDASQTKLVANIRVEGVGHESITRDARIREMVLSTIDSLRADATSSDGRQAEASSEQGAKASEANRLDSADVTLPSTGRLNR